MNAYRGTILAGVAMALGACATWHRTEPARAPVTAEPVNSDAAWAQLDLDHNGFLSVNELEGQHASGLLQDMHDADTNGDGRISRNEWNAWWPRMTHTPPSPTMQRLNATTVASTKR